MLDAKHSQPRDVDRLRNELELGRTLHGLSVVEPTALASYQGLPALELADFRGIPLDRLLDHPLPIDVFLHVATQVARVVADIHGRGLIHKDLKPHNVLFDPDTGAVRLADFCIASRIAREQTTARPARLIEGSLPYVSPEQTGRMNRSIDSRSDLYSLGVTFYQLLTGRLPFEATDAVGWVYGHVARRPAPPDRVRPSVPAVLSALVLKLLAKVPDERYQSAAGLAEDLERCLAEWRARGDIRPFELGQRDVSDRFLIPQRLYGRAEERARLFQAFERVAVAGAPELVLVSGPSGIGKSSVVHELHQPIVSRRGVFARGKFEQYKRDVPYFTIARAFRELMLDLLAESASAVAAWRARLQTALGSNGQLLVDLIPEVGLVIGPQPPVPELSFTEAENRLHRVFREFLGAFGSPGQPLTLFLDDLQWADPASLKLLLDAVTHTETRHLLVIGAYRDNEVGPSHPLTRALAAAREEGARIHALTLEALPEAYVDELVADTVLCPRAEAEPLARLVREKTGGNPLFVVQFLTALHRQGLIWFDRQSSRWRWSLARIRAQRHTDNVVALMVSKLHALPAETQEALERAACLGAVTDAETLRLVFDREPDAVLRAALEGDLLLQEDSVYRFPHDRVQEAAYSMIPVDERARVHLDIGRRLLARTPAGELEEKIFDVVGQLNRGAALVTAQAERDRIAELDLTAGKRAQRSTAYASALEYFRAAAEIVGPGEGPWTRRFARTFENELRRAECELVTGALEAAESRLAGLEGRAGNVVDAGAVACLQVKLYTTLNRSDRAITACLAYMRRVGVVWPAHPTRADVKEEFIQMCGRLGDRPIETLVDLPAMTDPRWRATVDVLMMATAPASFSDENLCCLIVARAVNLSLEHGNAEGSSHAYVLLGELLGPYFGDYRSGFRFGKLGFDLMEKRGPARYKALVTTCFAVMVSLWTRHFRNSLDLERRAFDVAEETGDMTVASYARNDITTLLLAAGDPLVEAERSAEEGLAFVRRAKFGLVADALTTKLRFIRMLRGLTSRLGSFDGDGFDERAFERRLDETPSLAIIAGWYWIRKLQARFLALDPVGALEAAAKAEPYLWTARSHPQAADFRFYAALAHLAVHDRAGAERRGEHLRAAAEHARSLERWAESCPDNFESPAALVRAELARVRGEPETAARLYEQAIRAARDSGFVHLEAIGYEVAAGFYRARGFDFIAGAYLGEARLRYQRWGAEAKVRELEARCPRLVAPPPGPATTVVLPAEQLDLLSVVKSSQTISSVMVQEELLRTLLRLVLEAGGARRAVVLLAHDGRLEVGPEAGAEDAPAPPAGPRYPESLLAYVLRTHERVLIDDAAADAGRYAGDRYFARAAARSVLCLPIRRKGEVIGVLYLENDLVPGAFTPERLVGLELLAAQAAISLENALLLERERAGRAEAEAAGRRARLLDEATAVMASTLDHEAPFAALTRLCVRSFADWAIVDLLEGDRTIRLAGAHRDASKEPLLRELAEHYPVGAGSRAPAATVLGSGAPLLLASVGEEEIRARAVDDLHTEIVRRLGAGSFIVVPLVARETRLGALTLACAARGAFGQADVELAAEIGRRAALAVDNARLLRETQRAVRLRDDFLSVASHELRTPMTSLKMAVDRLLRSADDPRQLSPEVLARNLARVKHGTDRLRRLTDALLDVTRVESGRLDLAPARVDLAALTRQVLDELKLELTAACCPARLEADQPVVGVWDPLRLEQVITNLLTNAMKFGAGRPIEIRVRAAGGAAQLSVCDHGVGIAPERQPFVFDRFERAVSASNYGGLGLGLYITRRIVEAHGGTLRLESQLGRGATFTVTLPALAGAPVRPD